MSKRKQWLLIVGGWLLLGVVAVVAGFQWEKHQVLRPQPTPEPTLVPVEMVATYAAQTVEALVAQQAVPSATPAVEAGPTATATPAPSATPTPVPWWYESPTPTLPPTDTPTPTITPTPAPCLRAFFVDETIPDGTQMEPGQAFTKTWKLLNGGSCTWTKDFKLAFVSGERMGAPDTQPLPLEVAPGYMIEVSVSLVAPDKPGTYRANFKLQDDKGTLFGLGPEGKDPFWVEIKVVGPTDTPTPEATSTPAPTATPTP